jgi:hypothetical protein
MASFLTTPNGFLTHRAYEVYAQRDARPAHANEVYMTSFSGFSSWEILSPDFHQEKLA